MSGLNDFKKMMESGVPHSTQLGTVKDITADVDGIFLDVDFGPDEEPISCEWINLYAGKDFGLYLPVSVGDYVTVFIPDGDTCGRPFSFGVMNDEEVTIPQDVLDNPDDVWLVMKPGQNVRIMVSDGGQIMLGGQGSRAMLGDAVFNFLINHTHKETGTETATPTQILSSSDALSDTVVLI